MHSDPGIKRNKLEHTELKMSIQHKRLKPKPHDKVGEIFVTHVTKD